MASTIRSLIQSNSFANGPYAKYFDFFPFEKLHQIIDNKRTRRHLAFLTLYVISIQNDLNVSQKIPNVVKSLLKNRMVSMIR